MKRVIHDLTVLGLCMLSLYIGLVSRDRQDAAGVVIHPPLVVAVHEERGADLPTAFRDLSMLEHYRVELVEGPIAILTPLIPGGREGTSFFVDGFPSALRTGDLCSGQICHPRGS